MSSTLYWRPEPKDKNNLDDGLKRILGKHFWCQDGSLGSSKIKLDIGNREFIKYFEGLKDAGVPDAEKLLEAVEKYGSIIIWIGE